MEALLSFTLPPAEHAGLPPPRPSGAAGGGDLGGIILIIIIIITIITWEALDTEREPDMLTQYRKQK